MSPVFSWRAWSLPVSISIWAFVVGCDSSEKNKSTSPSSATPVVEGLSELAGSSGAVAIRFSPDGRMLASAHRERSIRLWDLQSRTPSATFTGHRWIAESLDWSPDGSLLASAACDFATRQTEIMIWDVSTRKAVTTLQSQDTGFAFVCFSPDGRTLASAGQRAITLWNVATWTADRKFEPHNNPVRCLDFSPDGKLLAAGLSHYNTTSQSAEVRLWNTESGKEAGNLEHRWGIETVQFIGDGSILAVAATGQFILWDVESQQHHQVIDTAAARASRVTISSDGALVAMCGAKSLVLLETRTGKELAMIPANQHFGTASFSLDGRLLAWPNSAPDGLIGLWEPARLQPVAVSPLHDGANHVPNQ
ncbi:MAG: WD40 repeat domain-containing protein [Planctomycetaceae bacterium]|nr:WD40 repeat domain-containing protein [Planctomycetaceae bacterium]